MKNKKHKDGAMWINPDYANKLKIFNEKQNKIYVLSLHANS